MASRRKSGDVPQPMEDESGPAAAVRPGRKARVRPGWREVDDRWVQGMVLASRLGGGGNVIVKRPDGTEAIIEVKQSKDAVPQLVEETRKMRLQGVATSQKRQQKWVEQVEQEASQLLEPEEPPQESARTRKRRSQKEKLRQKLKELKQLQEEKIAREGAETAAAAEAAKRELNCVLRRAVDEISKRTKAMVAASAGAAVTDHKIAFGDGYELPLCVVADTVGATMPQEELGQLLVRAFEGQPEGQHARAFESVAEIIFEKADAETRGYG